MDSHNQIYINCEKVELSDVRAEIGVGEQVTITLAANPLADVDVFVEVLDIVREVRDPTVIRTANFPNENLDEDICPNVEFQNSQLRMTDEEYERRITGVWHRRFEENDRSVKIETKYNLDGTGRRINNSCIGNSCEISEFTFSWRVTNGVLISIENPYSESAQAITHYDQIDSITHAVLVIYEAMSGDKQIHKRTR